MTPEEAARRAVACTATGALSGLPKWEWCIGMRTDDGYQVLGVFGDLMMIGAIGAGGNDEIFRIQMSGERPNLADEPTVLAMLPLVRRAWTGHVVDLTLRADGNVDLLIFTPGGPAFIVDDVPLYEALTLALEAAPEKPCSHP